MEASTASVVRRMPLRLSLLGHGPLPCLEVSKLRLEAFNATAC